MEQHMNLPWEVLDACNGFSLDIGEYFKCTLVFLIVLFCPV